ncbi:hypothetical protein ACJ8BT_00015 [Klebsiella pneumoniae]|uniref:hypothetical protein n=1 Tax=Klebsiella pneumoniae TaxID=573 RepID=UPI0039BE62E9
MLDLLNLPGIKPVDMRHEGKCLVIVAEPVTVEVPLCGGVQHPYAQTRYAQKQVHGHAVVHGAGLPNHEVQRPALSL